jgi:hypothetical protein
MIEVHRPDPDEFLEPGVERDALAWLNDAFASLLDEPRDCARILWATLCPPHQRADEVAAELRILFQLPTRSLLGLKSFRDTYEGTFDASGGKVLWCAHEVQKGVQLALRQSHMMLEMLGGHPLVNEDGRLYDLLRDAVTVEAARTYREMGSGLLLRALDGDEESRWPAIRHALTGLRLATEHQLTLDGVALVNWSRATRGQVGRGFENETHLLFAELEGALEDTNLPNKPRSYDEISRWLVGLRMACTSV